VDERVAVFEAVEASHVALRLSHRLQRSSQFELDSLSLVGRRSITCFAAMRRYAGLNNHSHVELATTSWMPAAALRFARFLHDT